MNWLFLFLAFISFFLLRALYYYYKLVRIKELKKHYYDFLRTENQSFLQHKSEIISLFKDADLQDFGVLHVEEVTYTQGLRHNLSGFNNLHVTFPKVVGGIKNKFEETIGTFKRRIRESYNPFFWAEFLLKFPQKIISYLNLSPPNSIMKVIQLLYWIVGFLVALDNFGIIDVISWIK